MSATFTTATTPLPLVRGRSWAVPMTYQNPDGTPIDITGFSITASIVVNWPPGTIIVVTDAITNPTAGQFTLSLTSGATPNVPDDQFSTLAFTLTDTLGNTNDFEIPINAETPAAG